MVDPVLFEVLRHRLWAINEEAAAAIARISGSPVANEAYDFNTGLMTGSGQVLVVGPYVMAHAAALDGIVEFLIDEYSENPGIRDGDMFATNDPYLGANHQADVAIVAPIFHEGERIMWCGSIVHQSDVGGPVAGSVNSKAHSIYEEAIPLAPIRMVEEGRVRKDLEREYLIRSRMPGLNALDLRGQIAANRVQVERVRALCDEYGREAVLDVVDHLVDTTEKRFRARLAELPDGEWSSETVVEHDGLTDTAYRVACTATKTGDELKFDFSASAKQAPAVINCSPGAVRGYVLGTLLTMLGYDMSWTPAGVWPAVEVVTTPGTIVSPEWPAGAAVGNQAAGTAVRTVVNCCVAEMLDGSAALAEKAMAPSMGSFSGQNISGLRADGNRFGTMLLDSLGGGMGARAFADGVDTGGMLTAPKSAIGNVEINEHNYPILYLWRRQASDSGGPGRWRGGVSGEHAYVAHRVDGTIESTQFGQGVEHPSSPGVLGGEPGSVNLYLCVRGGAKVGALSLEELDGEGEVLAAKGTVPLAPEDVFIHAYAGGGGLGDPLEREPELVFADVRAGTVSVAGAERDYAVVVTGSGNAQALDAEATTALRGERRRARLGGREPKPAGERPDGATRLGSGLDGIERDGATVRLCGRCQTELGPASEPLLDQLAEEIVPMGDRWPDAARLPGTSRFAFRRRHCPGCGAQVDARVRLEGDGSPVEEDEAR
jgi:N-methylhydantoinase B